MNWLQSLNDGNYPQKMWIKIYAPMLDLQSIFLILVKGISREFN